MKGLWHVIRSRVVQSEGGKVVARCVLDTTVTLFLSDTHVVTLAGKMARLGVQEVERSYSAFASGVVLKTPVRLS